MSDQGPVSVSEGGVTITSTSETAEQITETLESKPETDASEEPEAKPEPVKESAKVQEVSDEEAIAEAEALEKAGKLGKPRNDPKARMLQATRDRKAAIAEREQARAEAAQYRREVEEWRAKGARQDPPKPEAKPEGKPSLDDYATYDEWVEAVGDWKVEAAFKARDAKAAEEVKVKEYKSNLENVFEKAISARKEYEKTDPAWYQKVSPEVQGLMNMPSIARDFHEPLRHDHVIADEIIIADDQDPSGAIGPRLALHLSQNPDVLQRLRTLVTPSAIQVEMRILARSLSGAATAGAAPRGEVSKARPPVRPVTGAPHTVDGVPGDESSYEAHRAYWTRKERERAQQR